ncbi:hypothetical protein [Streptomyces venezuelae]|uniref:hypothetical protein n=1 Tax=Streptomyces venezuelae TaxID=54571 RepID=UPI00278C75F7|nr:hypothetical protein [Streptomyces venezuelae]
MSGMSLENPPPPALIRIPVRIVVLVVVLPVRVVWDLLAATAHFLDRTALRPAGRGIAWVFTRVGRGIAWVFTRVGHGITWLARHAVARPAGRLYRSVLTPLGHGLVWVLTRVGRGIGWFFGGLGRGAVVGAGWLWTGLSVATVWLAKALFVWPWAALWRYVVVPVCRYGIAVPADWLYRHVLVPLGTGLLFLLEKLVLLPVVALFRYVLLPLVRYGLVVPLVWLHRNVLAPVAHGLGRFLSRLGHGLAVGTVWLAKAVFVWPWAALWRYLVVPVAVYGIARPLGWLWNRVLVPVAREVADALAVCWRVAGFVSRAVGRALKWVAWTVVGRPVVWAWRNVCAPVGHWVRDQVWAPARTAAVQAGRAAKDALASARAAVREARRDTWRALVGSVRSSGSGEPEVARARTLGSTTNVPGAAPAPEISPRKRG